MIHPSTRPNVQDSITELPPFTTWLEGHCCGLAGRIQWVLFIRDHIVITGHLDPVLDNRRTWLGQTLPTIPAFSPQQTWMGVQPRLCDGSRLSDQPRDQQLVPHKPPHRTASPPQGRYLIQSGSGSANGNVMKDITAFLIN